MAHTFIIVLMHVVMYIIIGSSFDQVYLSATQLMFWTYCGLAICWMVLFGRQATLEQGSIKAGLADLGSDKPYLAMIIGNWIMAGAALILQGAATPEFDGMEVVLGAGVLLLGLAMEGFGYRAAKAKSAVSC